MAAELKFYADATALIGLARIGRLDLLTLLPVPVYATAQVWAEATDDSTKPGVADLHRAREEGLVAVVQEGDPEAFAGLGPGECTVLSAAAAAGAGVLIDERRARTLLATDPALRGAIPGTTGVVGLILLAKRRGYIPAMRPLLDQLLGEHFRISPALYQDVLRQAGEV